MVRVVRAKHFPPEYDDYPPKEKVKSKTQLFILWVRRMNNCALQ